MQPIRPLLATLAFDRLSWSDFEEAVRDLISRDENFSNVEAYGVLGDSQAGIDIRADLLGQHVGIQVKRREQFSATDVRAAIAEAVYPAAQYILVLSRRASVGVRTVIDHHENWQLWDQLDLSDRVRRLPRSQAEQYIERHFHISWNEAFLGSLGGRPEAILGDGEAEAFSVERSAFEIESLTQFSAYPRYQLSITPGRYINNFFFTK